MFSELNDDEFLKIHDNFPIVDQFALMTGVVFSDPIIEGPGIFLTVENIKIIAKIMRCRGNFLSDIKSFIEMIENNLQRYQDFDSWKNDPTREKGPVSISECHDYAFRAKKYNETH